MPASIYSIVIESPYQQEDMLTEATEVALGRSEEMEGEFLRIADPAVSRQQARIIFTGDDQVRIINLGASIELSSGYVLKQDTEGEFFLPIVLSIGETTIRVSFTVEVEPDITSTVVRWMEQVQAGDDEAAEQIWNDYYRRLMGLARLKLGGSPRRVGDEEDVVVNAFDSFFRAARDDRFDRLQDRSDLWRVLAMLVARKSARQIEHQMRQKRGGGQVRGESIFFAADDTGPVGMENMAAEENMAGDYVAEMQESLEQLLGLLPDDQYRVIANMRMEGHSNQEIAESLGCTERTVERRLQRIREIWEQAAESDS
ncbi:MAG: sigma-70 family RNA polymerase sigma factor [Pirellulaceae bacterium]